MDFPTSDADFRPFINRDIRLISKKSVTYVLEPWQDVMCPLPKEQRPNSADEEMPQRPLVGMDTNLPVIVSTKALQSTGYTDCVDIEAGRGRGRGRARGKG